MKPMRMWEFQKYIKDKRYENQRFICASEKETFENE